MAAYYSFDSMGIITKQGIGSTSDVTAVRYRITPWREKSAMPPSRLYRYAIQRWGGILYTYFLGNTYSKSGPV